VPTFQRFDLDGTPNQIVITNREMKRRWASFHGDMRAMSGTRMQRTLGRMLGENTIRYKVARLFRAAALAGRSKVALGAREDRGGGR
jgi:hypothetical protein